MIDKEIHLPSASPLFTETRTLSLNLRNSLLRVSAGTVILPLQSRTAVKLSESDSRICHAKSSTHYFHLTVVTPQNYIKLCGQTKIVTESMTTDCPLILKSSGNECSLPWWQSSHAVACSKSALRRPEGRQHAVSDVWECNSPPRLHHMTP